MTDCVCPSPGCPASVSDHRRAQLELMQEGSQHGRDLGIGFEASLEGLSVELRSVWDRVAGPGAEPWALAAGFLTASKWAIDAGVEPRIVGAWWRGFLVACGEDLEASIA